MKDISHALPYGTISGTELKKKKTIYSYVHF